MPKLLNVGKNAKTVKSKKVGYLTGILYLAPADLSGREVCPSRSPGCTSACLNTAGHGAFSNVQQGRVRKTKLFFEARSLFMAELDKEIRALVRKATREGLEPDVRLNGTSDLPWEAYRDSDGLNVFQRHPDVQFYDYTKTLNRALKSKQSKRWPPNYHLTFSRAEDNEPKALKALKIGVPIAVVFKGTLPNKWHGAKVLDGDKDDSRHQNPDGSVIGLVAKGKARKDTSGFVVQVQ